MTIIIFLFLLLFGGCTNIGYIDIFPVYPDGPPPTPMAIPTLVAIYPTFTPTPTQFREISPTPTLDFSLPSPTPTPSATEGIGGTPCTITIRQPPANSPTRIPSVNQTGGEPIDMHLAFCATTTLIQVGEEWQMRLKAVELGLPIYQVNITDADGNELSIRYNPANPADYDYESNLSALSILSSTTYDRWDVILTFVANEPSTLTISAYASGELHFGYPGPATWTATATETFILRINE